MPIHPGTQRTFIFVLTMALMPFVAGLYGILHDQLTYTISEEYYTRFKFIQFGLWIEPYLPAVVENPRLDVCIVGFGATWWTGILIGPVIACIGLIHRNNNTMKRANIRAVLITLLVTFVTGIIGLLYGWLVLADSGVGWRMPQGLIDVRHYIMVGSMHNFSYLGGLLGLIAAVIYHIRLKRQTKSRVAGS
jgi:uncharacterized BrkB/YihY/UPF0761 family membrane protein